nr:MAG TPA: hypothetical protein [Caudoviricetes sp.]
MFEQILKELKTKYKDLGLSENVLKATAEFLGGAVKEESEIESAVAGVEGMLKVQQSIADQNRTYKAKIEELEKRKTAEPTPKEPKEEPKPNEEMPEWAKKLMEGFTAVSQKVEGFEKDKQNLSNEQKLISKLKELGVNENFYKLQIAGRTFQNDEEIEIFANSVKDAEAGFLQQLNDTKLGDVNPPSFGGNNVKAGEVSPDVQAYIKQKTQNNEGN